MDFFLAERGALSFFGSNTRRPLNFNIFFVDAGVFAGVRGGVKYFEAKCQGAILKDTMQVLQNFLGVEVGDYFLQGEDQFSSCCLCFVLFLDMVERGGIRWFLPVGLRQFEELVEYEGAGFLLVPSIGNETLSQSLNFEDQVGQGIPLKLVSLHYNYYLKPNSILYLCPILFYRPANTLSSSIQAFHIFKYLCSNSTLAIIDKYDSQFIG